MCLLALASWSPTAMWLPPEHDFRKHTDNLRAVKAGVTQAERAHKDAIRRRDEAATEFAARVHQLMIGLLAEAELKQIVSDPSGFNDKERGLIGSERSKELQWKRAVELAIRRHYSVPIHLEITDANTATGVGMQYASIVHLLENDLSAVIGDRNKLAHAQWKWRLNSKETDFLAGSAGSAPLPLNYLASRRTGEVITLIGRLVHTLAISEPTFQRDYSRIYSEISALRLCITGSDYPDFVKTLRSRHRQGG
jgi:hypothetical protein